MTNNHIKVTVIAQLGSSERDALSTVMPEYLLSGDVRLLSWVIPFDDKNPQSVETASAELVCIGRSIDDIVLKAKVNASIFRPCDKFDIDVIGDFGA